jgi:rare lipoprotein A
VKLKYGSVIAILTVLSFGVPSVLHAQGAKRHHHQTGIASVYSTESGSGTASGQRLNPRALTAAHRSLPFGTKVKVTNKRNGKSVVVTINDRGPFVRGRVIDLTKAAASAIGMGWGLAPVELEVVG